MYYFYDPKPKISCFKDFHDGCTKLVTFSVDQLLNKHYKSVRTPVFWTLYKIYKKI